MTIRTVIDLTIHPFVMLLVFSILFQFTLSANNSIPWIYSSYNIQNITLGDLVQGKIMVMGQKSCLSNTHEVFHSRNQWSSWPNSDDSNSNSNDIKKNYIMGKTLWINEFMAPGHMMYDLFIIELLSQVAIDRIIIQRAPCARKDFCEENGNWNSFFKGLYTTMLKGTNRSIPIYLRFQESDHVYKPHILNELSIKKEDHDYYYYDEIPVRQSQCFSEVYTRYQDCESYHCFYLSISAQHIHDYKTGTYAYFNTIPHPHGILTTNFNISSPIVVTLSYRGPHAARHISNIQYLISMLENILKPPTYKFNVFLSSNTTLIFEDQASTVASSHIVISEHGAFQANTILMRNYSLLIDLQGSYEWNEFTSFKILADMFGVLYSKVKTKALTGHGMTSFEIHKDEIDQIIDIIQNYVAVKPYLNNI